MKMERNQILDYLKEKTLEILERQDRALKENDIDTFRTLQHKVETLIEVQKEILKGE